MTMAEVDRAAVVLAVVERRLRQGEAAARLGLSVRQAKRCRERGAAGMASGHRGRRPNNALDEAVRRAELVQVDGSPCGAGKRIRG